MNWSMQFSVKLDPAVVFPELWTYLPTAQNWTLSTRKCAVLCSSVCMRRAGSTISTI